VWVENQEENKKKKREKKRKNNVKVMLRKNKIRQI
jgi:hypothetical protein